MDALNMLSLPAENRLLAESVDAYAHAGLDAGAEPELPPATVVVDDEPEEISLPEPEPVECEDCGHACANPGPDCPGKEG